jgi:hypothetical protein
MSDSEKQPQRSDMSAIYVDFTVPATLRYSGKSVVSFDTLEDAWKMWQALPGEIKRDASIKLEQEDGALYRGWEIYRLWRLRSS